MIHAERLYLDTNVLINWSYSRQNRYFNRRAIKLIEAIEKGRYVGIVSNLTLMEFYIVLKKLYLRDCQVHEHPHIEKRAKEELDKIFLLMNVKIVKEIDIGLSISKALAEANSILLRYPGRIVLTGGCYRLKYVGIEDALHLLIAQTLGCSRIATFETSFRDTSDILPVLLVQRDKISEPTIR